MFEDAKEGITQIFEWILLITLCFEYEKDGEFVVEVEIDACCSRGRFLDDIFYFIII